LLAREFDGLDVIASCIQSLDPNCPSYRERFEKYDYVVVLNQHTTYDFLTQYEEYAEKMIFFLLLGCAKSNLKECYNHYREYEWLHRNRFSNLFASTGHEDEYQVLQYTPSVSSQMPESNKCGGQDLLTREDLAKLVGMGARGFKFTQGEQLKRVYLEAIFKAAESSGRLRVA
jgi:hypothetical protein